MKKIFWNFPIVAVVGLFLLLTSCQNTPKNEEQIRLINALNDSIRHYKNEKHNLVAKISVFESRNKETFLDLETKNKEILTLQQLLKNEKAKVATILTSTTKINRPVNYRSYTIDSLNSKAITKFYAEEPYYDINIEIYNPLKPTTSFIYNTHSEEPSTKEVFYDDPKSEAYIELALKDTINIVHKRDEFGKMYVEAINKNPYVKINSLRSYYETQPIEKQKSKKFSIGPNLSYGVNHKGEFLPYIGVGVQYNLFKF